MTKNRFIVKDLNIQDNSPKGYLYLLEEQGGVNALCNLINGLNNKSNRLEKDNKRLQSDLAKVIEQASKNDKFLRSDIRTLENALWCPNCANDIKRLKELRKEFLK